MSSVNIQSRFALSIQAVTYIDFRECLSFFWIYALTQTENVAKKGPSIWAVTRLIVLDTKENLLANDKSGKITYFHKSAQATNNKRDSNIRVDKVRAYCVSFQRHKWPQTKNVKWSPTPFSGTAFHALSHDVFHFVLALKQVSDRLLKKFNQRESGFPT